MAIEIIRIFGGLPGGSQSALALGSDSNLWVLKFRCNPQHTRVLANEYIVSKIIQTLGLSVPRIELATISRRLVADAVSRKLIAQQPTELPLEIQFASLYIGGLLPGVTVTRLPSDELRRVRNLDEFAGILAVDLWTFNADRRQVVFHRKPGTKRYRAHFIDQGNCLNAERWHLAGLPPWAVYHDPLAYAWTRGLGHCEPWLSRIESFCLRTLDDILKSVPLAWYEYDQAGLQRVSGQLERRRRFIRDLLPAYMEALNEADSVNLMLFAC